METVRNVYFLKEREQKPTRGMLDLFNGISIILHGAKQKIRSSHRSCSAALCSAVRFGGFLNQRVTDHHLNIFHCQVLEHKISLYFFDYYWFWRPRNDHVAKATQPGPEGLPRGNKSLLMAFIWAVMWLLGLWDASLGLGRMLVMWLFFAFSTSSHVLGSITESGLKD